MNNRNLTPQQIENWRKVLCGLVGPYALIMPVEEIEAFRDKMEAANAESEPPKDEPKCGVCGMPRSQCTSGVD